MLPSLWLNLAEKLRVVRYLLVLYMIAWPIHVQDAASQIPKAVSNSDQVNATSYETLLESKSVAEQREALNAILKNPGKYASQIQNSLRDYPHLLKANPMAAKRAAYLSALMRDPSFADILAKHLGNPAVEDECLYDCPIIFALAIQAKFGSWKLPVNLDSESTPVEDLKAKIQSLSNVGLKPGSIEDEMQGPWVDAHRKDIEGKTEEQLIELAGPNTVSKDIRQLAISRLATLVNSSKNRLEFYLLALNDFGDASSEYRGALYQTIYRAEVAKARGL